MSLEKMVTQTTGKVFRFGQTAVEAALQRLVGGDGTESLNHSKNAYHLACDGLFADCLKYSRAVFEQSGQEQTRPLKIPTERYEALYLRLAVLTNKTLAELWWYDDVSPRQIIKPLGPATGPHLVMGERVKNIIEVDAAGSDTRRINRYQWYAYETTGIDPDPDSLTVVNRHSDIIGRPDPSELQRLRAAIAATS